MFPLSSGWHSLPFLYTGIISVDRNYFKYFKFTTINMTQIKLSLLLILAAVIIEPIQIVAVPLPVEIHHLLNPTRSPTPPVTQPPVQANPVPGPATHPHPPVQTTVNPASTGPHANV